MTMRWAMLLIFLFACGQAHAEEPARPAGAGAPTIKPLSHDDVCVLARFMVAEAIEKSCTKFASRGGKISTDVVVSYHYSGSEYAYGGANRPLPVGDTCGDPDMIEVCDRSPPAKQCSPSRRVNGLSKLLIRINVDSETEANGMASVSDDTSKRGCIPAPCDERVFGVFSKRSGKWEWPPAPPRLSHDDVCALTRLMAHSQGGHSKKMPPIIKWGCSEKIRTHGRVPMDISVAYGVRGKTRERVEGPLSKGDTCDDPDLIEVCDPSPPATQCSRRKKTNDMGKLYIRLTVASSTEVHGWAEAHGNDPDPPVKRKCGYSVGVGYMCGNVSATLSKQSGQWVEVPRSQPDAGARD